MKLHYRQKHDNYAISILNKSKTVFQENSILHNSEIRKNPILAKNKTIENSIFGNT